MSASISHLLHWIESTSRSLLVLQRCFWGAGWTSHSGVDVDKHNDKQVEEGAHDAQHGENRLLLFFLGLQRSHILKGDDGGGHGPDVLLTTGKLPEEEEIKVHFAKRGSYYSRILVSRPLFKGLVSDM